MTDIADLRHLLRARMTVQSTRIEDEVKYWKLGVEQFRAKKQRFPFCSSPLFQTWHDGKAARCCRPCLSSHTVHHPAHRPSHLPQNAFASGSGQYLWPPT